MSDTPPEQLPPVVSGPDALDPGVEAERPSRLKRSVESVKTRAEDTLEDLERRRADVRFIDVGFKAFEHDLRTGGGILAGAVAFRFFLFVVPYVFVVVFVLGVSADAAATDPVDLARKSGILGIAASAVESTSNASTWTQIVTLGLASWALVSGARTLVKSLRAVHALIWHVPLVKPKRLTLQALVAILATTVIGVLIRSIYLIQHTSIVLWLVATTLLVAVPCIAWLYCTMRVFPSAPGVTWHDLLPGAVFLGIGVQVLHVVTVVWIARSLESKSETYGAMGAALTILLWAFLLGRLVTGSATLSAVLWADKLRREDSSQLDPATSSPPHETH